ncbi:zinc finger MYM-type protein 1-like [Metopolophium dirhodum]|uniref:zinc finger MYM-type protein 1-like n=1 Tax=Metopolophium dirhodum TaxID=44670 RepID=UPI00298F85A8|nr:zinc finger MYM-type protein 1-like [Metopolophium dirhodum]
MFQSYPMTKFGQQNRSFNASYYDCFEWLEYSIINNALYCFACRIYGSGNNTEDTFTKIGFKKWNKFSGSRGSKKGQGRLHAHATTKYHLTNKKWQSHKDIEKTGSVMAQVSTQHKLLIESNRRYIRTLCEVTLFLCRQGLAFRGHNEAPSSMNQGNFKEACNMISKLYPEFAQKYKEKTNYTSHGVQDELINICAGLSKDTIIQEVEDVGIFGIMCDEAR